jgi:hypothetical protein
MASGTVKPDQPVVPAGNQPAALVADTSLVSGHAYTFTASTPAGLTQDQLAAQLQQAGWSGFVWGFFNPTNYSVHATWNGATGTPFPSGVLFK